MKKKLFSLTALLLNVTLLSACGLDTRVSSVASSDASASTSSSVASSDVSVQDASASASASSSASSASSASTGSSTIQNTDSDDDIVIVFIGDSQMARGEDDGTSIADYVHTQTGYKVYNIGCAGTTASNPAAERYTCKDATFVNVAKFFRGEMDSTMFDTYGVSDVAASIDPAKVDYYVVEYGVNDFLSKKTLADTVDSNNVTCYVNALHIGFYQLQQASPNAKIIACCPCYAQFWGDNGGFLGDGNIYSNGITTLSEYAANFIQTAQNEGCITFDAYNGKYIDLNQYTAKDYLMDDGIHLTPNGRETFAAVVSHLINRDLGKDNTYLDSPYKIADYQTN